MLAATLPFSISEDGALHAETFLGTTHREHATARAPDRVHQVVALTRVMASHHSYPASGVTEPHRLPVQGAIAAEPMAARVVDRTARQRP